MPGRNRWIPVWFSIRPEKTPHMAWPGPGTGILLILIVLAAVQAACNFPVSGEGIQPSLEPVIPPLPSLTIGITPSITTAAPTQTHPSPTQTIPATQTQEVQPNLEIIDISSEELNDTPKYKIIQNKPVLSGGQDLVRNFNQEVYQIYQAEKDDFIRMSEENEEWRSQNLPEFSSWLDLHYELGYFSDELISLNVPVEVYIAGMAHPNHFNRVINYNLLESRPFQLKDLFLSEDQVLPIIAAYCEDELRSKTELLFEEGVQPSAANFTNWVITEQGLLVVFDPYRVAPGAAGTLKVTVPWEILLDEINPQGPLVRFTPE